jgi:hypothetical protein
MRYLAALLATLALVGCGTAPATRGPPHPEKTSTNAPVEFLITSAATDFHTHRPPYPVRVRNVRIGYVMTPDGTRQYLLCGAFLAEGSKHEWTPFVTIKTSGYEQWLGTQAVGFCERSSIVWIEGDFSPSLQSRLDSLR